MSGSIVTFEKPIKHLGLADWHAHTWETQQTANTRRADTFELRHQARQLRNETRIKTEWDTYHNDVRLADRITELGRWKETLEEQLKKIESDIRSLTDEKAATERELDFLDIHISIINECITARDARGGSELTYDDADTELKKELCVVEGIKKMLIDRCQSCWEKINRLKEVKFKVQLDINDKTEAIEIDKDMLTLDKHCTGISFKPDPLGVPKRSISHQNWLEHSRYTKLLADNELADTAQMREALFIVRERARNNLKAQRETADYALRKRIYEIQRSKNEVQWQGLQMKEEMQSTLDEIIALEAAFQDKTDAIKLAETRLQARAQRPGYEASRDEPEMGIRDELTQLLQTRKDLADKIDCAKATYNALEDLQVKLNEGLENKNHALMTDLRCLDLRARLKSEEGPINTETQRNIVLTKMEKEIPPT